MKPRVDRWALTAGIIVITSGKRAHYGNDVAAAGRVGAARSSVCGRVGHVARRPCGHRAARVPGREEACTSRHTAAASAGADHRAASKSRTRAATQVKPRGNAVHHLTPLASLSKPAEPPPFPDGSFWSRASLEFPPVLYVLDGLPLGPPADCVRWPEAAWVGAMESL